MPQYQKHNVSKHARDRQARLQWLIFIEKLIAETEWTARSQPETLEITRRDGYQSLGNGCYWKQSYKNAE